LGHAGAADDAANGSLSDNGSLLTGTAGGGGGWGRLVVAVTDEGPGRSEPFHGPCLGPPILTHSLSSSLRLVVSLILLYPGCGRARTGGPTAGIQRDRAVLAGETPGGRRQVQTDTDTPSTSPYLAPI
jgi:hypothetical protein